MAVTNLTNTTWVLSYFPTLSAYFTYNINFTSNQEKFSTFKCSSVGPGGDGWRTIEYDSVRVYTEPNSTRWESEAYKMITITGGEDVTNSDLITFLEANASQVQQNSSTNTTWVFNENIYPTMYAGSAEIKIQYTVSKDAYGRGRNLDRLHVFCGNYASIDYANTNYQGGNPVQVYSSDTGWTDDEFRTITITGGEDVTNGTFISFLEANATQVIKTTINDQLTRIENAKADIISAIREKGVEVPEGTLLSDMASYIAAISDTNYKLTKSEDGTTIILQKTDETVDETSVIDNDTVPETISTTDLNTILTD